jgi:beta-galactosidase
MRRLIAILFVSTFCSSCLFAFGAKIPQSQIQQGPRQDVPLVHDWRFMAGEVSGAEAVSFADDSWEKIDLPHTWNAKDGQEHGDYRRGPGWYRLVFEVPQSGGGKRLFLKFEAASTVADVYLNGEKLGQHIGGFGAFIFEITKSAKLDGKNVLAVRVDNSKRDDLAPIKGDFTVFGGLYRNVHLLMLNPVCISPLDHASPGVKILTNVSDEKAELTVTTQISSPETDLQGVNLAITIYDANGQVAANNEAPLTTNPLKAVMLPVMQGLTIEKPHLWNGIKDPYLYQAVVELKKNGEVLDRVTQAVGLRYYKVDQQTGFYLNGKPYFLHGVNVHQDRINKGWAISANDEAEDVAIIKEMGANVIRACHYQHSQNFYSLCDQAGILVWAEIPQVDIIKNNPQFEANSREMLLDLIRQSINHPSIFTWSLSNEIGNGPTEDAVPNLTALNAVAHQEDPTRPTVQAACMNKWPEVNKIPDILGWNAYAGWYFDKAADTGKLLDKYRTASKSGGISVSEYGAGGSIYQHEINPRQPDPVGKWHPEEFQTEYHIAAWTAIRERPWIWGSFIWNMFDFAVTGRNEGDTPGRNDKGMVTYDRKTRKDSFYFYQANWIDEPMVYIASQRYTLRNLKKTPVMVFSNCEVVELFVNGKSFGTQKPDANHMVTWKDIILSEGKNQIKVLAVSGARTVEAHCEWTFDPNARF